MRLIFSFKKKQKRGTIYFVEIKPYNASGSYYLFVSTWIN